MPFSTTRRRFLAIGAGGAALLGVGGTLRWVAGGYRLPAGELGLVLSTKEMVVVRALIEVLVPGGDGLPSGLELGVAQRIDEELWAQPDAVRADLRAALHLLEHAPPLFGFFGRLSSLGPEKRLRAFERMREHGPDVVVQAAAALKQLAQLHYYGHPAVWSQIGYDGPWVREARPPESHIRYLELLDAARAERGRRA
jgi:hypothetical protein